MKGISTIIAAIILVVITIGLIATAYLYFAGIISPGAVIALSSGYCDADNFIQIGIRNDGTSPLPSTGVTIQVDGASTTSDPTVCGASLAVGATDNCNISTGATPPQAFADGQQHTLSIYGPRNSVEGPITC